MSNANQVKLDVPASTKYLNVVSASIAAIMEHLSIAGDIATTVYEIQLAVHEICTNIIEHAYKNNEEQRIELEVSIIQTGINSLNITLFDYSGIAFIESDVKVPDIEALQERGMGLMLVNQIMDEVTYTHMREYNRWQLTKKFKN